VDGIEKVSVNTSAIDNLTPTFDWYIGYNERNNSNFNGLIDDVKIFNYALTANQVKTVYNEGAAVRFGPNAGQP